MATPTRQFRQSHLKSKTGCLACKRRHVRCDEFKPICLNCQRRRSPCHYVERSSNTPAADTAAQGPPLWTQEIASAVDRWLEAGIIPPTLQAMPEVSWLVPDTSRRQDARIVYHGSTIVSELGKSDGHLLAVGLELFSIFLEMAFRQEYVRYAFMALSTTHLSCITRSTALSTLSCVYRRRAIHGLRVALERSILENAEDALAASVMLGWTSETSMEYARTLQGTLSMLKNMQPSQQSRRLVDFMSARPALQWNRRLFIAASTFTDLDLKHLGPLRDGLGKFVDVYSQHQDLCTAARSIANFLENLRLKETKGDIIAQAKRLYEVNNWMPWMPRVCLEIGLRRSAALVIMMYFDAMFLAARHYLPEASPALFLPQRVVAIDRDWTTLNTMEQRQPDDAQNGEGFARALDLAVVPLLYAKEFWTKYSNQDKRNT